MGKLIRGEHVTNTDKQHERTGNVKYYMYLLHNGITYYQHQVVMFCNKDEFVPPEWRSRTYQKSFLPFAVSLWNSLEEDTRTISNYELFKETLMGNVNDNPLFHLATRQEQIIMARLRMHSSDLKGHLHSMKIIESSTCSCEFKMKFISF